MNGDVIELYSDADLARMRRHIARWRRALWILGAAALAVCVCLTALADTRSAQRMEQIVIAVSTLAGWIVIYGGVFVVTASRRELAHAEMLRREERQRVEGQILVTDQRFTIRKSVAVRRVEVRDQEQTHRLLVCESRAGALAAAEAAAVYTCHGYVAAYEVRA